MEDEGMQDASREVSRPFVELKGRYGDFALKRGKFNLYYAYHRPDWLDVGGLVSVYVLGPNGGIMKSSDPGFDPPGDETFVGEVVSVERLRLVDLEERHLMPEVPSCATKRSLYQLLRRRGALDLVPQDPVEVVSIRRLSYRIEDMIGPLKHLTGVVDSDSAGDSGDAES